MGMVWPPTNHESIIPAKPLHGIKSIGLPPKFFELTSTGPPEVYNRNKDFLKRFVILQFPPSKFLSRKLSWHANCSHPTEDCPQGHRWSQRIQHCLVHGKLGSTIIILIRRLVKPGQGSQVSVSPETVARQAMQILDAPLVPVTVGIVNGHS